MQDKVNRGKVSIIMPTYNRAGYIRASVESIIQQTYSNWELIIVDDGSVDNTESVVRSFESDRIRFISAERSGIGGITKNIGIRNAIGEFLAFNDSDDLWDREKLERQLNALTKHTEAGFCVTGGYNFRTEGVPVDHFYKIRSGEFYGDLFEPYFRSELAGFTQALMFKRECLEKTGLFLEEKSFSDIDFIISLSKHFKGVILYDELVFRRLHAHNYIHGNWIKSYEEGISIIKKNATELRKSIRQEAYFRLYINYGEKWLVNQNRMNAIRKFISAWRYRPLSWVPLRKIAKAVIGAGRNDSSLRSK